jgi:hypothetical protein
MPSATVRVLPIPHHDLRQPQEARPVWSNLLVAYLARVDPSTRSSLRYKLDDIARHLSGGRMDAYGFPWQAIRYEHANQVRSWVMEAYAISTANHQEDRPGGWCQ